MKKPLIPLALLFVLSVLDGVLTMLALSSGKYYEVNPLMRSALEQGDSIFVLSKLSLTLLSCILLYRLWDDRFAKWMTIFLLALYTMVNMNHIVLLATFGY